MLRGVPLSDVLLLQIETWCGLQILHGWGDIEVLKYRQYRIDELREAFFQRSVFFSRSSNLRAGCPGKADIVQAFLTEEDVRGRTKYSVVVEAHLQSQVDYISESLAELGYTWIEGQFFWSKSVRVEGKPGSDSLSLLIDSLKALDDLVSELPMCIYETRQTKRLRNYVLFMTAWKNKMRFSAIVDYRSPKRDQLPKGVRKAAQSPYIRRRFDTMADSYRIAELPDKHWCAWVDGDEAIPVFPNEILAVRFLENRHVVYSAS